MAPAAALVDPTTVDPWGLGTRWRTSPPLPVLPGAHLVRTGVGPGQGLGAVAGHAPPLPSPHDRVEPASLLTAGTCPAGCGLGRVRPAGRALLFAPGAVPGLAWPCSCPVRLSTTGAAVGAPGSPVTPLAPGSSVARRGAGAAGGVHRPRIPPARRQPVLYRHGIIGLPSPAWTSFLVGQNEGSPPAMPRGLLQRDSGGDLLSQGVTPQVPSAQAGLTSVFGKGTGVTPPP